MLETISNHTRAHADEDRRGNSWIAATALGASIAALAGASCCVLPIILAGFGVTGAWIAMLGPVVAHQTEIALFAGLCLMAAWAVALLRGASRITLALLGAATAALIVSLIIPHYEQQLTRYFLAWLRS